MSRKIVLLNLALVALAAVLGWRLRTTWLEAQAHEHGVLEKAAQPAQPLPPPEIPAVQPAVPSDYIDVAQRTLFSPDRDPNVVIEVEAPPPPKPPPPVPPLPAYYGQMALGEPVVVLGFDGKQASYHAGEKAGNFTVVSWDRQRITLEWSGGTLERELEALRPPPEDKKQKNTPAGRGAAAAAQRPNSGQIGAKAESGEPALGRQVGAFRTCVDGDTSPAGTVKDGFRKVMTQGLMGSECHWEQIQ